MAKVRNVALGVVVAILVALAVLCATGSLGGGHGAYLERTTHVDAEEIIKHRTEVRHRLIRQLLRFLGQFEFGGPWPQHNLQRCLAHHCSHVPKAGHDGAHKGDRLFKADADVEEHLGSRRRLGVCAQQNGSIGILNPRQSDRILKAL
jgi:hypothetical protein